MVISVPAVNKLNNETFQYFIERSKTRHLMKLFSFMVATVCVDTGGGVRRAIIKSAMNLNVSTVFNLDL